MWLENWNREALEEKIELIYQRMLTLSNEGMEEACSIGIIDFDNWEWSQGIGLYGMYQYYQRTGRQEYLQQMIAWYDNRLKEGLPGKNVNTTAPLLALAYLYEITGKPEYLKICKEWAEWILIDMPKTKEGGFQHTVSGEINEQQIWDDTLYMAVLFLGKMGTLLQKSEYLEEAHYQFLLHAKYLYDEYTGLWFHGWSFLGENHFSNAFWARGNSWIAAGIPDYLEITGLDNYLKRYLVQLLECQIEALIRVQRADGMWTTLLNDPDSYEETSATAAFGYGILKAVRMGFIEKKYQVYGEKALKAVLERIDTDGTVKEVSYGTGMGTTLDHYRKIPLCPMPYGQSLAMLLLVESLQLF